MCSMLGDSVLKLSSTVRFLHGYSYFMERDSHHDWTVVRGQSRSREICQANAMTISGDSSTEYLAELLKI